MLLGLTILCLATVPIALSAKLHEQMTIDEVAEIFDTTPEFVPDYQTVQFHLGRLNKRDTKSPRKLTTVAFGSDISLFLQPAEGYLASKTVPVYTATESPEGTVIYNRDKDSIKNIGRLHEDVASRTSLVVATNSNGEQTVTGYIGSHNLVVKPVPERIAKNNIPTRRSRIARSAYHIVFKREVSHTAKYGKTFAFNETISRLPRAAPAAATSLPIPSVLYPEIMVVIDSSLFAKFQRDMPKTLRYALAFWNGVDLMYRSFDQPKFRLNIVRFIIALTDGATPYLSGAVFAEKDVVGASNYIDVHKTHSLAKSYFYRLQSPINKYDVAMAMTSRALSTDGHERDVGGIASVHGACAKDDKTESQYSLGIITDDGIFNGVLSAAHEFGHLLGAVHDDSPECPSTAGYIMSDDESEITENGHDFSQCSITSIDTFLKTNKASCFYNEPKKGTPAPRILPGSILDRNQHCRSHGQGDSCFTGFVNQLPCSALHCLNPNEPKNCRTRQSWVPPEGAFCGVGKICVKGQCVAHIIASS